MKSLSNDKIVAFISNFDVFDLAIGGKPCSNLTGITGTAKLRHMCSAISQYQWLIIMLSFALKMRVEDQWRPLATHCPQMYRGFRGYSLTLLKCFIAEVIIWS